MRDRRPYRIFRWKPGLGLMIEEEPEVVDTHRSIDLSMKYESVPDLVYWPLQHDHSLILSTRREGDEPLDEGLKGPIGLDSILDATIHDGSPDDSDARVSYGQVSVEKLTYCRRCAQIYRRRERYEGLYVAIGMSGDRWGVNKLEEGWAMHGDQEVTRAKVRQLRKKALIASYHRAQRLTARRP
jgi:hypothetical protein